MTHYSFNVLHPDVCEVGKFACETEDECVHWSLRCEKSSYEAGYVGYEQCSDGSDDRDCGRFYIMKNIICLQKYISN